MQHCVINRTIQMNWVEIEYLTLIFIQQDMGQGVTFFSEPL